MYSCYMGRVLPSSHGATSVPCCAGLKKENVNETRANIIGIIHISSHVISGGYHWQKDDIIVHNKLWQIMPSESQIVLQS